MERRNFFVKFNVDGLLRGDYEARMRGHQLALQSGWMSVNEVRELEDMNKIPAEEGGDIYMINGNMLKLRDCGAAYKKNNADTENDTDEPKQNL